MAKKIPVRPRYESMNTKDFMDMISPSTIKFEIDHYIVGNTFRCIWSIREYPTATDEQAILRHLGEKDGVTLKKFILDR